MKIRHQNTINILAGRPSLYFAFYKDDELVFGLNGGPSQGNKWFRKYNNSGELEFIINELLETELIDKIRKADRIDFGSNDAAVKVVFKILECSVSIKPIEKGESDFGMPFEYMVFSLKVDDFQIHKTEIKKLSRKERKNIMELNAS